MAKLYKRGKVWWYQFRGRRVSTRCTDKRAAELAARELERRAADPTYQAAHETTIEQCLSQFIGFQSARGRAEGTVAMNTRHAGHLLRIMGRHSPLHTVDAGAVDRYIERRFGEGASRSTIHKELSTLRGALRAAARRGEYRRPLIEVMPQGFQTDYRPRETALTLPQVEKLLLVLPADRAATVAWIVATGSRWKEATSARPEDVEPTRILLRGTKTAGSWRQVPRLAIYAHLVDLALPHLPFRPWGNVRRDLALACERARVPAVTPNDLRRTCATILRHEEVEPHLLAIMLGHRDSRMVERVYGRLSAEALGNLIEARTGTKKVRRRGKRRASG